MKETVEVFDTACDGECPIYGEEGLRSYERLVLIDGEPIGYDPAFNYCSACGYCLHCDLYGDTHHDPCPPHGWVAKDGKAIRWL